MAKVFLDKNESYSITDNSEVFGNIGSEEVAIQGLMNTIHSTVERIEFDGVLSSYTFAVTGNVVTVKNGADTVAVITVPDNVNQTWAFADGSASVNISGLNQITLGGVDIPTTQGAISGAALSPYDGSDAGTGKTFTLKEAYITETHEAPATEGYLMWEGIPVESGNIEEFFKSIAGTRFKELGEDLNDIKNINAIEFNDDDSSATISYNLGESGNIEVNTTVTLEYLAILKTMIFDEFGNPRLTFVHDDTPYTSVIPQEIVLTTNDNNGGTIESGFTTAQNDVIVAGRPELLHGAYIDGGSGRNTLEVEMKGVFAQPLQLLNIHQINVENMPNIYSDNSQDDGSSYPLPSTGAPVTTASALDLTNATDLELLVISEGTNIGDINGAASDIHLGELTVAGIRNNATVRLEGNFTEDVTLHFGEGVGVNNGEYTGEINVELRLGATAPDFGLNVAHNASVLHLESQGYENIINNGNFGGNLSKLEIAGTGALTIEGLEGFKSGSIVKPVVIDASANTGGVDLALASDGADYVRIIGSQASDDIVATGREMVSIVSANNMANVFVTNDSATVNITTGSGNDMIQSVRGETVTINAGDGNNDITVSAEEINITTGAGNDKITISGMETDFINGDDEGYENTDNYEVGVNDNTSPGALLNINAGDGVNTITLGRDVPWGYTTLQFGVTALEGSVISGSGIKLFVENNSDLTEADLTAATFSSIQLKQELTLTAAQFHAIGSDAFSVYRAAFGATEDLHIVVTEDTTLSDLVDLAALDTHVRLNFEIRNGATLTLSAEELHKYVAEAGIASDDGLNGKVHITDAGLSFDAFDNGDNYSVIDGGTLAPDFEYSGSVTIDRTVDGWTRPEEAGSTDTTTIDTTGSAALVIDDEIVVNAGNPTTLKIIGDQDVVFNSYVDLGDGENAGNTIDFSTFEHNVTGLTVKNFDNVGLVMGNNTDTRVDVELTGNVGSEDQGLVSSGVEQYVVTAINDDDNNDEDGNEDTATFYMCDETQDVQVIGLKGNAGKTVTFKNVPWGLVAPTILLEGDGYANYNQGLKVDGNPNASDIGNIVVDFFTAGASAVVDINNAGVELGVSSTGGERFFDVGTITVNNASMLNINVTEGDAVIAGVIDNGGNALTDADDLKVLTITGTEDVTIEEALPSSLTAIDAHGVAGSFTATLNDMDDAFSVIGAATATTLVLNGVDAEEGTIIDGGAGVSTLAIVGDVDLDDAAVSNIDAVVLENGAELSLNFSDFVEIGNTNISVAEEGDTAILNLAGLNSEPFSVPGLNDGISIGTVTLANDPEITLDPATDLTGITSLTVPEGTILNLTAAQFQQLEGAGLIICEGSGETMGAVNITDLTQADVDGENVLSGLDNLDLSGIDNLVSVTLAESVSFADGGSLGNAQTVVMGDGLVLTLAEIQHANGLAVVGGTGSVLQFVDTDAGLFESIDASKFDVDTLKVLSVLVDERNVELMFSGLGGDVAIEIYSDFDFLEAVERTVIVDAGTTVPGFMVFNQYTDDTELTELNLNLMGGTLLDGNLRLSTVDKADDRIPQHFNSLTINSEGTSANTLSGETANIITGNITPLAVIVDTLENDLKEVVVNATQDFILEGELVFNSVTDNDAMTADDDTEANVSLSVNGDHDVTLGAINVEDDDIESLEIHNNLTGDAVLTITGGSPAIYDDGDLEDGLESLTFTGTGDIALGTEDGATGIDAGTLSVIDASELTGNLDLGIVDDVDSENFTFTAGTGVTTMTLSDVLDIDDSNDNGTPDAGWAFDFTNAAAGSVLTIDDAGFTEGDLTIALGANTTLVIAESTDLSTLDDVSITGTNAIVLAAGVTLTLTAQQAHGLTIVADPSIVTNPLDPDYDATKVPVVNIVELNETEVDLSGIAADIAGVVTLEVKDLGGGLTDQDVTLAAGTDLGAFTVQLDVLDNADDSLEGQVIRFATVAQAAREIQVNGAIDWTPNSTSVVWLFEDIAAPVDTSRYDAHLGRLWVSEALVTAEGGLMENLFTTLPSSILRVDFNDPARLDKILSSSTVDRTVEIAAFSELTNLTFSDTGASPEEHIHNLTLKLGGDVTVGNINVADAIHPDNAGKIDPDSIVFDTLIISSERALHQDHYLAPEAYVNNNDGPPSSGEYIEPENVNIVGDIGSGAGLDLLNVYLTTNETSFVGDGSLGDGANLEVGTITFDSSDPGSIAYLSLEGENDIQIEAVNTSDVDITRLYIDAYWLGGTVTVTGASPALQLNDTEILDINGYGEINFGTGVNSGVAGNTLSLIDADDFYGTLNLGTISQVDGANFTFNTGNGVTTLTMASADSLTPTLAVAGSWTFNLYGDTTLTFTDDVVLGAGDLAFNSWLFSDSTVVIDGNVNFATLANLTVSGDLDIELNAGSSLVLSQAQWSSNFDQLSYQISVAGDGATDATSGEDVIVSMAANTTGIFYLGSVDSDMDVTFRYTSADANSDTISNFTGGQGGDVIEFVSAATTKVYAGIANDVSDITNDANVIVIGGTSDITTAAALIANDVTVTGTTGLIVFSDGSDTYVYHTTNLGTDGTETLLATLDGVFNPLTLTTDNFLI